MTPIIHDTERSIRAAGPCPLHAVRECATCFRLESECDYGSCQQSHTVLAIYRDTDNPTRGPVEARPVCEAHATILSKLPRGRFDIEIVEITR